MLIPHHTLARLSPTAAKIYLALLAAADLRQHLPAITLPISSLTRLTGLSERTCAYALRQLRALHLIQSYRRGKNAPCTYQLLQTNLQPAAGSTHHPQPDAPLPSITSNPMHPLDPQPMAGHPPATPAPAAKTHDPQPHAPLFPNPPQAARPSSNSLDTLLSQLARLQNAIDAAAAGAL